jgi:hypothetical protein
VTKTPSGKKADTFTIPAAAITVLEKELAGLVHGTASLTLHVRDGWLARFTTGRERSFMGDGAEQADRLLTGGKK